MGGVNGVWRPQQAQRHHVGINHQFVTMCNSSKYSFDYRFTLLIQTWSDHSFQRVITFSLFDVLLRFDISHNLFLMYFLELFFMVFSVDKHIMNNFRFHCSKLILHIELPHHWVLWLIKILWFMLKGYHQLLMEYYYSSIKYNNFFFTFVPLANYCVTKDL